MSLSKCYWFHNYDEIQAFHGSDILADGSGTSFELDDVIFVYDNDGVELFIYVCTGYLQTEVSDQPQEFTGPYRTDVGYPHFMWLNFDYTTTRIELIYTDAGTCATDETMFDICQLLDRMAASAPTPMFIQGNVVSYPQLEYNIPTLMADEANWEEEPLAQLDWTEGGVQFSSLGGGVGSPLVLINEMTPTTDNVLGYCWVNGVNGSKNHYMQLYGSTNTGPNSDFPARIIAVDQATGIGTIVDSQTFPFSYRSGDEMYMAPETYDAVAIGDYNYTDTKTNEGRVIIMVVNTDFTFGTTIVVTSPVPERNGYFGRFCCLCLVEPTSWGPDRHLFTTTGDRSTIVILTETDGYSSYIYSRELDRNDLVTNIVCGLNHAVVQFWDDSNGTYMLWYYFWNGNAWSQVYQQVGTTLKWEFLFFLRGDTVVYGGPGQILTCKICSSSNGQPLANGQNTEWATYGIMDCPHFMPGQGGFVTKKNMGSYDTYYLHELDLDTGVFEMAVGSWDDSTVRNTDFACGSISDNSMEIYTIDTNNKLTWITGVPGTAAAYVYGDFWFKTTAASRFNKPVNFNYPQFVTITQDLPQYSDVHIVISMDQGATWWYESGGVLIQQTDIEQFELQSTYVGQLLNILDLLDWDQVTTIDFMVWVNRPLTVAESLTPIFTNIKIYYATKIGVETLEYRDGTINFDGLKDERIALGTFNIDMDITHKLSVFSTGKMT